MLRSALKAIRPALIPFIRGYVRHVPKTRGLHVALASRLYALVQSERVDFEAYTSSGIRVRGNTMDLIQRYIYYFGQWEPALTAFLGERLRPGDGFIDVGANIGYFTALASKIVGKDGGVLAIEASPRTYGKLCETIEINRLHNVRALNLAVSDAPGEVTIYASDGANSGEASVVRSDRLTAEATVRALPLDAILDASAERSTRMVKIDVEGAEWHVVAGMRGLLARGRQDLEVVVEITPSAVERSGTTVTEFVRFFGEFGFTPYKLANDYSPLAYLSTQRGPFLSRLDSCEGLTSQMDLVFSRQNLLKREGGPVG